MDHASIIWAIIGFLLIFSEFFVPEFVIFFFGVGALLISVLTALIPGLSGNVPLQILLWAVASGSSIFALRKYLGRVFRGRLFRRDDDNESIGKTASVVERITPEVKGRIRYQGTTWSAFSLDGVYEPGEHVEIMKKEGLNFYVTRAFLEAPTAEIEASMADPATGSPDEGPAADVGARSPQEKQ